MFFSTLRSYAVAALLLGAGLSAHAQTPTPTPDLPKKGTPPAPGSNTEVIAPIQEDPSTPPPPSQEQAPASAPTTPAPPSASPSSNGGTSKSAAQLAATSTAILPPSQVKGPYKKYLNERYASDREARAVVHMFRRKQRGGIIWMGVMGTTLVLSNVTFVVVSAPTIAIQAGLFLGVGARKEIRFSNQRLYEILRDYDQNYPFPAFVRNKVKDKDYK